MSVIHKLVKNISSLFIAQIILSILSLVLSIFIARFLGDVAFGKYSFAIAFPTIFLLFLDFGFETLLIRDVAREKSLASEYLTNILVFKFLLIPIVFSFIVISINIMGYPESTKNLVYLISLYTIFMSLSAAFKVTFRAYEKMEYDAGISTFFTILRTGLAILFLYVGYGLIEIGWIFVLSTFIECIISYLFCTKKFAKPKLEFDFLFLRKSFKYALPLGIFTVFSFIFVRIDTVMLSYMKGDAVVGWYNAAYSLILGFTPIPQLFMMALLPLLSYSYISSRKSLQITYEKSFKYLFFLGLPISVGIFMLSKEFIILFYGNEFINSIDALKILTWDVILKFLYVCAGYILISTDNQKKMAILVVFSAFLNIVLNLVLIPSFSYIGSGVATLITELFLLISYLFLNTRNSFPLHITKFLFQPIIASGIMAFFLYLFPELQLLLKIILAIIIYFIILFLIKGFTKDDILSFKQIINRDKTD
jgi:O-antigen/teichoic acid export membrane protein